MSAQNIGRPGRGCPGWEAPPLARNAGRGAGSRSRRHRQAGTGRALVMGRRRPLATPPLFLLLLLLLALTPAGSSRSAGRGPAGLDAPAARRVLNVTRESTRDEIRAAFRRASLTTHPDKDGIHRTLHPRGEAYEVLRRQPRRRRRRRRRSRRRRSRRRDVAMGRPGHRHRRRRRHPQRRRRRRVASFASKLDEFARSRGAWDAAGVGGVGGDGWGATGLADGKEEGGGGVWRRVAGAAGRASRKCASGDEETRRGDARRAGGSTKGEETRAEEVEASTPAIRSALASATATVGAEGNDPVGNHRSSGTNPRAALHAGTGQLDPQGPGAEGGGGGKWWERRGGRRRRPGCFTRSGKVLEVGPSDVGRGPARRVPGGYAPRRCGHVAAG